MKASHTPAVLIIGLLTLPGCSASAQQHEASSSSSEPYKLVWSDELEHDGPLNPDDWGYENGFVRNRELQWSQPENASCKDGHLVIEARREQKPNPKFDPAKERPAGPNSDRGWRNRRMIEYTSASVNT